nr:hypothetical protein CFP56_36198 [Quercus suber]
MSTRIASSHPVVATTPPRSRRKKDERKDIWSSLLRQTREAQARSRTQAVQSRSLILCGGTPDDQRAFVQSIARPPPSVPSARNRDQRPQRAKGEVRLSNRYAYGYGHVTLFSPPQQSAGMLSAESEEAARLELHTVPEPERGYEQTLRRLLEPRAGRDEEDDTIEDDGLKDDDKDDSKPAVVILLSWTEPWRFLELLRRWLQLLARALVPADRPTVDPIDILRGYELPITLVIQHVEAQEELEREGYREESFDYISQCLRTCMLPLQSGLVYTSSNPPPQQPGSALTEIQKLTYSALHLDVAALSPAPPKTSTPMKRDDLAPQHNFVDRMAIVIPSGWDSAGKIRLISETFSPEALAEAWSLDLNTPIQPLEPTHTAKSGEDEGTEASASAKVNGEASVPEAEQTVFSTSAINSDDEDSDLPTGMSSPTKPTNSAITSYETTIQNPNAHKTPKPPSISITTKETQAFLQDMRKHLQSLEAQDAERTKTAPSVSQTSGVSTGRLTGVPTGEQTGALDNLGDVSFNVGGVSYNTVSAEAAIEKLRIRAPPPASQSNILSLESPSPRTGTPQPPRRRGVERSTTADTNEASTPGVTTPAGRGPRGTAADADFPSDKLEEYFASLMKKGGGGGGAASAASTPSKAPGT